MVPVAICAALFGKWELTTCNAVSVLTSEPSTSFQSSNRAHTKISWLHGTTCYMVATGLHPVEPQALLLAGYPGDSSVEAQSFLPAGYSANYTNRIADPVHNANYLSVHTVR